MEEQGAGKQQASSKQAAPNVCPLERMIKYKLQNSIQFNTKIVFLKAHGPKTMKSLNH
jgi:hypothetical protein